MRTFDDEAISAVLPWDGLIEAIERIVVEDAAEAPPRTVHPVPVPGETEAFLLLKPGWVTGELIGVKAVTVFPANGRVDLPMVQAGFLLFDGRNGSLVGACEANALTTRRTAAASAVAAKRLARADAARLLVVGSGALAPMVAQAHAAVREYDRIEIWGRTASKAEMVVADLAAVGLEANLCTDLDAGIARADVISAVTGATAPLIKGALLRDGTHVDLIGAFNAEMRESDDEVITRASIFVDTREDAVLAGDLAQPLAAGLMVLGDIRADLAELVAGDHRGRTSATEITVFKSAGFALEDLAAARLAFER